MLWNLFILIDGRFEQVNSEPYDSEQIAIALDELGEAQALFLLPAEEVTSISLPGYLR